ncbi:AMP-binding protein [Tianweitania sediminis]
MFAATAARHPHLPFAAYRQRGAGPFVELSYGEALKRVLELRAAYRDAGWGRGARGAILTGNRPEFYLHYLALNGLGVSIVPLNPEARPNEMLYIIEHSEAAFIVAADYCRAALAEALAGADRKLPIIEASDYQSGIARSQGPGGDPVVDLSAEAAILYTSGTTGRPKGCLLSNRYFVEAGRFYASWQGRLAMQEGKERLLNPLPLFHMNNLVVTTTALISCAGCNVMIDRFSPTRWWTDCKESEATLIHYLGVMPALLLAMPGSDVERENLVRAGVGAGVDPKHHRAFEQRFGFPLLELWGMTEVGRGFIDNFEPRQVGTRAFGRPAGTMRARVVDDAMNDVDAGTPGELLVQSDDEDPRRAFFSGYLKDEAASGAAWHDDWFRTGDVVRQDESGMLYFVDRKKNIVRRSGENIAAAEVEACLQAHPKVVQAAIIAVPDDLREEEVFACVVLKGDMPGDAATAHELFEWSLGRLSYFKAPGYVCFRKDLPTTGTQKIQKALIFAEEENPVQLADTYDFRDLKRKARVECPVCSMEQAR